MLSPTPSWIGATLLALIALGAVGVIHDMGWYRHLSNLARRVRSRLVRIAWAGRGLRLTEVCVLTGIVACLLGLFGRAYLQWRETSNRASCRSNLKQIGLALLLYRDNEGGGARYPAYNGSRFLVSLYGKGYLNDSDVFLCPSSGDSNARGKLLTLQTASQGTSYAGIRNRPAYMVRRSGGGSKPWWAHHGAQAIASDDDEGTKRFNHGDVVNVLFHDGHVEEMPLSDPRVSGGLGGEGALAGLAN